VGSLPETRGFLVGIYSRKAVGQRSLRPFLFGVV
jgi:hypothetical protein